MEVVFVTIAFIIAYLIGSIPTAIWYGRRKFNIDIREHGSGNAGATNTFRVLGKKAGWTVMLIDVLKGVIAATLPIFGGYFGIEVQEFREVNHQLICGMGAVIGHILPLYANFKGGKGVATLLGVIFAINPWAALACLGIFLVVFLITKYVSLGSMLAGLAFPIILLSPRFWDYSPSNTLRVVGFILAALLIYTHRKNIRRLIDGEENKISFGKNKN